MALGDSYLELVAVVDTQSAAASRFGRWVAAGATSTGRFIGWAARPPDLDATAARLGLRIDGGSRTTPSGERVVWRSAGLDEAIARPWLPFFIEWDDMAMFPGSATAPGAVLTRLAIEGDVDELSDWLGEHGLPTDVRDGEIGVASVVLDGPGGRVVLDR